MKKNIQRKPEWLKVALKENQNSQKIRKLLAEKGLNTVCVSAKCPNLNECWCNNSSTFMILGNTCTRGCRFCAVNTGKTGDIVDKDEPIKIAGFCKEINIKYAVITSVTRDDLKDYGASQFKRCISEIKKLDIPIKVELLIPDFNAEEKLFLSIIEENPFVIGHNIETVERLTPLIRDKRCDYWKSIETLRIIKKSSRNMLTKSSLLVGFGETETEILKSLNDLKNASVDIVAIGQYLQPTRNNLPVSKYYTPEEFSYYKKEAEKIGFKHVFSGPLVRSSYMASSVVN